MYEYRLYEYEDLTIEFKPYPRRDRAIRSGLCTLLDGREAKSIRSFPSYEKAADALESLPAPAPFFTRLSNGFYAVRFDGAVIERCDDGDADALGDNFPAAQALLALADAYFETEEP